MTRIATFLMFEGEAEAAITLYTSLAPNSRIVDIKRHGKGEAGKEGTVMHAAFILAGDGISSNRFEHRSRLHVHAGDVAVFDLRQ